VEAQVKCSAFRLARQHDSYRQIKEEKYKLLCWHFYSLPIHR